jgi:hypothetical protein
MPPGNIRRVFSFPLRDSAQAFEPNFVALQNAFVDTD